MTRSGPGRAGSRPGSGSATIEIGELGRHAPPAASASRHRRPGRGPARSGCAHGSGRRGDRRRMHRRGRCIGDQHRRSSSSVARDVSVSPAWTTGLRGRGCVVDGNHSGCSCLRRCGRFVRRIGLLSGASQSHRRRLRPRCRPTGCRSRSGPAGPAHDGGRPAASRRRCAGAAVLTVPAAAGCGVASASAERVSVHGIVVVGAGAAAAAGLQ